MFLNALVFVYFRNTINALKLRRWNTYCHKTEWVAVKYQKYGEDSRCPHCKRIRTTHLTLDGLRLQTQKKFVDKNAEARLIQNYYYSPIRRRLEL